MSNRKETIKNARSLNDVVDIVNDIAFEFKNSASVVKRLISSLSSKEITMDWRDTDNAAHERSREDVKFVAPKIAHLSKHVEVINKLYDNLLDLSSAEAMVKQSFAGHKNQAGALKQIAALKNEVRSAVEDAFEALSLIAQKHVPTKLDNLADGLKSHIIDELPTAAYKDILPRQTYVIPDPKESGSFHFCDYIGIDGLKDESNYSYDDYYIVVTCVITKEGAAEFFVNGFPDFKTPGKYPLGVQVKALADAKRTVSHIFAANHFITEHERLALPITGDRAKESGIANIEGVTGVDVDDDELVVYVRADITKKNADSVINAVLGTLNRVAGTRKNDTRFKHSMVRREGKKALSFILTPNIGNKVNIAVTKLREVGEVLGLTDKQLEAFKFAMQLPSKK